MIKITEHSRIFVWGASPEVLSGGAEVLNLLAATLKTLGAEVCMFNWGNEVYIQPEKYKKMFDINCGSWKDLKDEEDVIIILPECMIEDPNNLEWFSSFKHAQFMVWWLSAGFIYNKRHIISTKRTQSYLFKRFESRTLHICESEVVARDLEYYGIRNIMLLQHGVNSAMFNYPVTQQKRKCISYNALKKETAEFVENKIIPLMPDVEFNPIRVNFADTKNTFLSKEEMCDKYYDPAKIFLDCAYFEGREMTPREAILRDCILFVPNRGIAANFSDYMIDDYYKFNEYDDPKILCKKLYDALDTYETRIDDFKMMKRRVLMEPRKFLETIYIIFEPVIKNKKAYDGFIISDPCVAMQ